MSPARHLHRRRVLHRHEALAVPVTSAPKRSAESPTPTARSARKATVVATVARSISTPVDTGSSPEKVATTLDQAGTWKVTVSGYNGDTGDFTLKSGRSSGWFIDSKQTMCRPDGALLVADDVGNVVWRVSAMP